MAQLLDRVTDPHNIGAILRSAASFGAVAVAIPEHGAPEVTGALAKAASGALEHVPFLRVGNLVRTMEALKEAGFWCVGLDEAEAMWERALEGYEKALQPGHFDLMRVLRSLGALCRDRGRLDEAEAM